MRWADSSHSGQTRPFQAIELRDELSSLPEKMSFDAVRAMVDTVEGCVRSSAWTKSARHDK